MKELLIVVTNTITNNKMTQTYTELDSHSSDSFKSRHLVAMSCRRSLKSRLSGKRDFIETISCDRLRQFDLYNGARAQGKRRLRQIIKKGFFGSGTRQNTFILDVSPPLLADVRKSSNHLVIRYTRLTRQSIDDIAIKNHQNLYCHLERNGSSYTLSDRVLSNVQKPTPFKFVPGNYRFSYGR